MERETNETSINISYTQFSFFTKIILRESYKVSFELQLKLGICWTGTDQN
jgi:hypothetical protein